MRILIIESEHYLARKINRFLQEEGFRCKEAPDGNSALELVKSQKFDLILLDFKLPDYDGQELIRTILSLSSNHAVIILSEKNTPEDRIEILNAGADDFMSKPFSLLELKSRILALIRRRNNIPWNILKIGEVEMDLNSRKVTHGKNLIRLTRNEYDILFYLAINKNKVVSRFQLSEKIWGESSGREYNSNLMDVHIKNLRRKLADHLPDDPLETIRGVGFRLNEFKRPDQ